SSTATLRSCESVVVVHCPNDMFFFSSRRRHTICYRDWSSDVCSSDLNVITNNWPVLAAVVVAFVGLAVIRPKLESPRPTPAAPEIGRASCREGQNIEVGAAGGRERRSGAQ